MEVIRCVSVVLCISLTVAFDTTQDPTSYLDAGITGDNDAHVTGVLGRSLAVRCLSYGNPRPDVSWYKNSTMVPFSSQQFEARGNILLIRSLSSEELGTYVCQAYNGYGKPASWTVTVQAFREDGMHGPYFVDRDYQAGQDYSPHTVEIPTEPPTLPPEPEMPVYTVPVSTQINTSKFIFERGSTLSLLCDVDGFPLPTVYWYKDGQLLESRDRVHISEVHRLTITGLTVEDTGNYGCQASNAFSSHTSSVDITVQGSGYIPESCTDSPYFANCKLIVRSKFCHHPYYSGFCCRSCIESGQLLVEDLPNYNIQLSKK